MELKIKIKINSKLYPVAAAVLDQVDGHRSRYAVAGLAFPGFGPDRHVLSLQAHEAGNVEQGVVSFVLHSRHGVCYV